MQTAAEAWRVAATSDALGLRVHEAGKEEAISWRLQWIMPDIFGDHPAGVDEDRYLTAAADLAATLLIDKDGAPTDA